MRQNYLVVCKVKLLRQDWFRADSRKEAKRRAKENISSALPEGVIIKHIKVEEVRGEFDTYHTKGGINAHKRL